MERLVEGMGGGGARLARTVGIINPRLGSNQSEDGVIAVREASRDGSCQAE